VCVCVGVCVCVCVCVREREREEQGIKMMAWKGSIFDGGWETTFQGLVNENKISKGVFDGGSCDQSQAC